MPLYDILNEFQKGHSHMAVVVKQKSDTGSLDNENQADGKVLIFFYDNACYSSSSFTLSV